MACWSKGHSIPARGDAWTFARLHVHDEEPGWFHKPLDGRQPSTEPISCADNQFDKSGKLYLLSLVNTPAKVCG